MTEDSRRAHRRAPAGGISRRGFLTAGATGLAGASLSACSDGSLRDDVARGYPPIATPSGLEDADWADIRAQFILEPGTAYMNNASLGMPPASVAAAVGAGYEALSREPLHGKHVLGEVIANRVVPGLAAFLGADPEEIVLTRNASEALHMGAVGVHLEPGEEVLITSQEHPAGRRPWEYRAARHGVKVNTVFIPSPFESEEQVTGLVEAALTPATRVIAFCHVTRGGHLYPVRSLCALARERGIVSHVDGAQAVGMFPVDPARPGVRHLLGEPPQVDAGADGDRVPLPPGGCPRPGSVGLRPRGHNRHPRLPSPRHLPPPHPSRPRGLARLHGSGGDRERRRPDAPPLRPTQVPPRRPSPASPC